MATGPPFFVSILSYNYNHQGSHRRG
ncbi:unnamed protein product [Ectocarpus sp. CCAP 1310/34]|nr:unnamed protein product [Ectocarpus sp. CCAP 1310/34]